MFRECGNLRSIEIPNGTEYIGNRCFQDSGIEQIKLPSTLKKIDAYTFCDCKSLKDVEIPNGVEHIG